MKFRIGYGGPRKYRHGQYFPGGRRNNGGMTEIERLIHLIASMQILFGSKRGGALIPLLVIAILVGGFFVYRFQFSAESALERAHAKWDSGVTKEKIEAIREYKSLLQKSDPIEPNRKFLMDDRDVLYRRIITHEIKFTLDDAAAAGWVNRAWDEQIRDLRFSDDEVKEFWEETTAPLRVKNRNRNRNQNGPRTFDKIPGIDTGSAERLTRFSLAC